MTCDVCGGPLRGNNKIGVCTLKPECLAERLRRWRQRNPTYDRDLARRRYADDPGFRERKAARNRRWYDEQPAKVAAHRAVMIAVRAGRLDPEPCLFCGAEKADAHHHSYAEEDRLNVTWLCRRHHFIAHRRIA